MQRTYYDMAGNYVLPPQNVTLASLGVPPYSPPDGGWQDDDRRPQAAADDYPDQSANADGFGSMSQFVAMPPAAYRLDAPGAGISFADMTRTISPAADPGAWREDNTVPFWIPDDGRTLSGPSFDDFVRRIDLRANPDTWREDTPRFTGWDDSDRYGAPYDARAAALGAFRIPGLPEDAATWELRESAPTSADGIPRVQLANGRGLAALWLIWNRLRGGRLPSESRAPAPSGRKGEPLRTPEGPPRNSSGQVDNRPYSGHAFDKMQDQRLPPSVIENTVRRGAPRPGKTPGTTRYFDEKNNLSVVVDNKTGRVITNHYGDR